MHAALPLVGPRQRHRREWFPRAPTACACPATPRLRFSPSVQSALHSCGKGGVPSSRPASRPVDWSPDRSCSNQFGPSARRSRMKNLGMMCERHSFLTRPHSAHSATGRGRLPRLGRGIASNAKPDLITYRVPWKGTVPQRVRIPPGKLSLQPVAIGADDGGNDIVRSTSV